MKSFAFKTLKHIKIKKKKKKEEKQKNKKKNKNEYENVLLRTWLRIKIFKQLSNIKN